ncbi:MAG: hypothetical protein ACRD9S_08415 [Pyrinomonadaceae bacterium]
MKQTLVLVLSILSLTVAGGQQTKQSTATAAKPEIVRLEPQAQLEIAEAQRQANEAKAALEAATAKYDAAQQRVVTLVYKAMAEGKLSPKEWLIKQDQGGIYMERIQPAETAQKKSE